MIEIKKLKDWKAPKNWTEIQTIDVHTCGEPSNYYFRISKVKGKTLLKNVLMLKIILTNLEKLMWEPRGHADMYGAIIVSPDTPSADFGVIFIHNEGYSTGCGHAVIA